MAVRVGINGFGRIGRLVFRVLAAKPDAYDVVAINDLSDAKHLALLLKYDSTQGRFKGTVSATEDALIVNGKTIPIKRETDPGKLPWGALKCQVVVESTGRFGKRAELQKHIDAGAERVILSAPSKDPLDLTVVLGVNDDQLKATHKIISNASCTTNCLAPMAKVLHQAFGIEKGLMTTVHAYTNDQRVADQIHEDPYRARAAAVNVIPSKTGAAKAVGEVIPELEGRLTGMSLRVPLPTGSITDLTVILKKAASKKQINAAFEAAAKGPFQNIIEYCTDPIVSSDIVGNPHSCIFVPDQTIVIDDNTSVHGNDPIAEPIGNFAKVMAWYDNEWGYSCRTAELITKLAAL
jgi:glyceraldehyde 3-phosphate dehydrogenase